jgi:hypothetical protein
VISKYHDRERKRERERERIYDGDVELEIADISLCTERVLQKIMVIFFSIPEGEIYLMYQAHKLCFTAKGENEIYHLYIISEVSRPSDLIIILQFSHE